MRAAGPRDPASSARYCIQRLCERPGCEAPRYRGKYCKSCAKTLADLLGVWQLAHACRAFLHKMMPCDVTCYAQNFTEMGQEFAIALVAAKQKEPVAIKSLLESWR